MTQRDAGFLAGVIEGFYGPPWTEAERLGCSTRWRRGASTPTSTPKDDLHHRAIWREPYAPAEAGAMAAPIARHAPRLRFVYGIGPGSTSATARTSELASPPRARADARARLRWPGAAVRRHPGSPRPDRSRAVGIAGRRTGRRRQRDLRVDAGARTRGARVFCPTPYCGRMAAPRLGGPDYLAIVGRALSPGSTSSGPARKSSRARSRVAHMQDVERSCGGSRSSGTTCTPTTTTAGASAAGRTRVARRRCGRGRRALHQPEHRVPLDYVALRTLGEFCAAAGLGRAPGLSRGDARVASRFAVTGPPIDLEDLVLFGDCYYLPHQEGPEAKALYALCRVCSPGRRLSGRRRRRVPEPRRSASRLLRAPVRASRSIAVPCVEPPCLGAARGAGPARRGRRGRVGAGGSGSPSDRTSICPAHTAAGWSRACNAC